MNHPFSLLIGNILYGLTCRILTLDYIIDMLKVRKTEL